MRSADGISGTNERALIVGPNVRLAELVQTECLADHRVALGGRAYHCRVHGVQARIFSCEESWRTRARSVTFASWNLRSERGLHRIRTDSE